MKNLALIGMPLCGKSTVAVALGNAWHMTVVDTDAELVKKYGNISEIFSRYGEKYFRDIETEMIRKTCARKNIIISTGGGCVLRKENVSELKRNCNIIYLKADKSLLVKRASGDGTRPLLNGGAEERINALYSERSGFYESAADFTVNVNGLSVKEVVSKITEFIK